MALIKQNMIHYGAGAGNVDLTMPAQYSARIKRLMVQGLTITAQAITVSIQQRIAFNFVAPAGWNLAQATPIANVGSVLEVAQDLGLIDPIPVASGELLRVAGLGAGVSVLMVYDLYDAGDVKAEEPNGSACKKYQLLQVVSNSAALAATGTAPLNRSDISAAFPAFPGGAVVPGNTKMTLKALFGAPVQLGSGAANVYYTTRLHMVSDQVDIDNILRLGRPYTGSVAYVTAALAYASVVGNLELGANYIRPRLNVLDPYMTFTDGDDMTVNCDVTVTGGAGVSIGEIKLGLLFDVEVA